MSWKTKSRFFRTLTFRLTLWYATLFGVLSLAVFLLVYIFLSSSLRRRTDEELLSKAMEFEDLYRTNGIKALREEFKREAQSRGIKRVFFRLLSPGGEILATSDLTAWEALPPPAGPGAKPVGPGDNLTTLRSRRRGNSVRLLSRRAAGGDLMQLGTTLRQNELLMEKYRETFGAALAVMLICGGVVSWLISRRAMSGVARVIQTAVNIGKGDLTRRVPASGEGQEIEDLARAFNEMLDRIQSLIKEMEEVTNNIAHDLRSPLTRVRGLAEMTLTSDADPASFRETAGAVIEEIDRLIGMIDTMLEIAQTEAGVTSLIKTPLDLGEIIREAVDLFLPSAENKRITLKADIPKSPLIVRGDRSRLQRVVANLLDNAVKFTGPGGKIVIRAKAQGRRVEIEVSDTGIGINDADLPHIFESFYRVDRSRSTPGNGLGLSLARSLVRAHGGDITVRSSPGKGSSFTVSLSLSPQPT